MIRPTTQRADGIVPAAKFVDRHLKVISEASPYSVSLLDDSGVSIQGRNIDALEGLVAYFGHDHVREYVGNDVPFREYTSLVDDIVLRVTIEGAESR